MATEAHATSKNTGLLALEVGLLAEALTILALHVRGEIGLGQPDAAEGCSYLLGLLADRAEAMACDLDLLVPDGRINRTAAGTPRSSRPRRMAPRGKPVS